MHWVRFVSTARVVGALCLGAVAVSAGAAPTLLAGASAAPDWVSTRTRAHAPAYAAATDAGAMPETDTVPIAVALPLRDKAALTALTDRMLANRSAAPLTAQQFLDRHAPTPDQVARVAAHLRANGFQNVVVADNRLLVTADGTAAQVRAAFRAELRAFDVAGRRAYANVTDALVPASLADAVLAVVGLQTVQRAHTQSKRFERAGAGTLAVTGVNPTLFASIYGAAGMPSATSSTIGIITQGSMAQTIADLKTFAANAGYPPPPVTVVTVGRASTDTSGVDEWNLDTQTALATAGGTVASMRLYTSTTLSDSNLLTTYNKAVSDNLARVVNVSLGECENSASASGAAAAMDQVFQTAVAQGQTFAVASGDSGSYSCGGSTSAQSYPAVSPYVMAIGGTTLSSNGGSWVGETAWSCTDASTCPQSAAGGTGGGPSLTEAAPSWQTRAGVLTAAPTKRGVPDISFDAAPSSGARIIVNGSLYQIGGTSLSAPIFTGFYSRIQAAHGNTLGFPAPTIYAGAASNPAWFHDVTSGSNGGYGAAPGWDYVTGWGSLQVQNYSSSLPGGGSVLTANFSCTASGATATCADASTDSGGTIAGYAWSFGDGGTASGANPSHTYAAAGTYTVTETVTESGSGKTATASASVTVAAPPAATTTWTTIASEGQGFSVDGTQTVRYGAGSSWITKTVTGSGTCSNAFFGGDPIPYTVKSCQIAATAANPAWTQIATENQSFTVNGTQTVRYGAGSSWVTKTVTGGGTCSNDFFGGDPIPYTFKSCQVASAASAVTWTKIASEGQSFGVAGTQTVRYGSGASFVTRSVSSGGVCSNDFFGTDPIPYTFKECDVAQ